MEKPVAATGGITFLELLTIVFVACKLAGCISWSWLWVLAPLWVPIAIAIGMLLVISLIYFIEGLLKK